MKFVSILDGEDKLIAQLFENEEGQVVALLVNGIKAIVDGEILTNVEKKENKENEIISEKV